MSLNQVKRRLALLIRVYTLHTIFRSLSNGRSYVDRDFIAIALGKSLSFYIIKEKSRVLTSIFGLDGSRAQYFGLSVHLAMIRPLVRRLQVIKLLWRTGLSGRKYIASYIDTIFQQHL